LQAPDPGALGIDDVAAVAGNAKPLAAAAFHCKPRTSLGSYRLGSEEVMAALEFGQIGPVRRCWKRPSAGMEVDWSGATRRREQMGKIATLFVGKEGERCMPASVRGKGIGRGERGRFG
jgi:hypothetical protein